MGGAAPSSRNLGPLTAAMGGTISGTKIGHKVTFLNKEFVLQNTPNILPDLARAPKQPNKAKGFRFGVRKTNKKKGFDKMNQIDKGLRF